MNDASFMTQAQMDARIMEMRGMLLSHGLIQPLIGIVTEYTTDWRLRDFFMDWIVWPMRDLMIASINLDDMVIDIWQSYNHPPLIKIVGWRWRRCDAKHSKCSKMASEQMTKEDLWDYACGMDIISIRKVVEATAIELPLVESVCEEVGTKIRKAILGAWLASTKK